MPHSSGGGSHGGGSHSSHSSHSSYSSYRSGSGGGRSFRMSGRPFIGASRYRYTSWRGTDRYVYCSSKPAKSSIVSFIFTLLFLLPFMFSGIGMLVMGVRYMAVPEKLGGYYDTGVYIEDDTGIIDDRDELKISMMRFMDKTGIIPYVITTTNETWKDNYSDLEVYAYELYINRFRDENHFLIVYSQPQENEPGAFVDWYWEGMQGDNTDRIITEEHFREFQHDLQYYLLLDDYNVGDALAEAFSRSVNYMMNFSVFSQDTLKILMGAVLWNGGWIWILCSVITGFVRGRRNYERADAVKACDIPPESVPANSETATAASNTAVENMTKEKKPGTYNLNGEWYDSKGKKIK